MNEIEIARLNKEIKALKPSQLIRIVWYEKDDNGVLSIYDICEFSRQWIITKKKQILSAEGIRLIMERSPSDDMSLIVMENATY